MSPHTEAAAPAPVVTSLAFVESPVQLLNVLEWAHHHAVTTGLRSPRGSGVSAAEPWTPGEPGPGPGGGAERPARFRVPGMARRRGRDGDRPEPGVPGPEGARTGGGPDATGHVVGVPGPAGPVPGAARAALGVPHPGGPDRGAPEPGQPAPAAPGVPYPGGPRQDDLSPGGPVPGVPNPAGPVGTGPFAAGAAGPGAGPPTASVPAPATERAVLGTAGSHAPADGTADALSVPLTIVVLSPTDPMTRGQLRRMADLARDEGHEVRWEDARGGATAPFSTVGGLAPLLRAARRIVIGDPFSRYVQLLLTITRARDLVVVDDGTATMEFIAQLARGERLVRWHRRGGRPGPRDLVFAPVSASARRRLTPGRRRTVEVFSSMPIEDAPDGVRITANDFGWTRSRFGPPRVGSGADLVGTSLVETGVVDGERYLAAVAALARTHGATRYFAHRREDTEKLHRLATETGLEIVRPDLPLELIARRGPIGGTIVSFPSTVVHTLPLALTGTGVKVAVCDIDPDWLTERASPRAQGFLAGVTGTARDVHRLPAHAAPGAEDGQVVREHEDGPVVRQREDGQVVREHEAASYGTVTASYPADSARDRDAAGETSGAAPEPGRAALEPGRAAPEPSRAVARDAGHIAPEPSRAAFEPSGIAPEPSRPAPA